MSATTCATPIAKGKVKAEEIGPTTWTASWIWTEGDPAPVNFYLATRRDFKVKKGDLRKERRLHIAADSRYRLFVNGEWIGDGPARSFYMNQQYDTYDLTGCLKAGDNTIAVLATHYGESTFHYNESGQAGLLVQLERRDRSAWTPEIVTDASWMVRRHEGYIWPTPRIDCQQSNLEIFDARNFSADWTLPKGAAPDFTPAKVVGPVGSGPWTNMVPRSIPFLTRTPIVPVRPFRVGLAQPANLHFGFNGRPYMMPGYLMQNQKPMPGFAATWIVSEEEQEAEFFTLNFRYEMPVINGVEAKKGEKTRLNKGENLCLIPFKAGGTHEFVRSYPAFTEKPVTFKGVFNDETIWTIFGPIEGWDELHDKALGFGTLADLEPYRDKAQVVRQEDIYTAGSPWMETTVARPVKGEAKIENLEGLFDDSASTTVIHPSKKGDIEIFLDFGKEYIGYFELDVDAPAGTKIDFNGIEEIEDGKRIHYTEGAEIGMRYICRDGRQNYTSYMRRGYRYLKILFRDMTGPVRVRSIKTLFSVYPSIERGAFDCSDSLLTRIWEVGRHTLRCCSEDTFTDCPTYEQTFWVGDARNEALINFAAYGDGPLARRCAELPAESLFRSPITESQVPSGWDNILTAWSLLWIQAVEEYWLYSGEMDYLKGIYPSVRTSLKNIRTQFTDERGLFSIAEWNMFDWGRSGRPGQSGDAQSNVPCRELSAGGQPGQDTGRSGR